MAFESTITNNRFAQIKFYDQEHVWDLNKLDTVRIEKEDKFVSVMVTINGFHYTFCDDGDDVESILLFAEEIKNIILNKK